MPAHARKNMQQHFPFSGESNDSSADDALVKETAALYLDPRNRLIAHGPDPLTELDTLTLLLGQRDHLLATRLLLSFGSLTALSRASLAQLTPPLSPEKAMSWMLFSPWRSLRFQTSSHQPTRFPGTHLQFVFR